MSTAFTAGERTWQARLGKLRDVVRQEMVARQLARVTVSGSGALLAASDQDAADLRVAVTSPGGTTQRALAVLMEAWPGLMSQAIAAATERSRELGG